MVVDGEAQRPQLMAANESDGLLFKMRRDPRVTPVGQWLRRWSLDELPQLINVMLAECRWSGRVPRCLVRLTGTVTGYACGWP